MKIINDTPLVYLYIRLSNAYNRKYYERKTKIRHKRIHGKELDLENPKTFVEKLQWLKLFYFHADENAVLAGNKIGLHEYLDKKGLSFLKTPIIHVYDSALELCWEELPSKFVLKKSNASGYNVIVSNKESADIGYIKRQFNIWMNMNFGFITGELHYEKMKSQIVVEKYIDDISDNYSFYCARGKAYFVLNRKFTNHVKKSAIVGRLESIAFFTDIHGEILSFKRAGSDFNLNVGDTIELPSDFSNMLEWSQLLSQDFPFVRVDFCRGDGRLMLEEMTFVPSNALSKYTERIQIEMGDRIILPKSRVLFEQ